MAPNIEITCIVQKLNSPEMNFQAATDKDHSYSTYAKFSKKLKSFTPLYTHVRVRTEVKKTLSTY